VQDGPFRDAVSETLPCARPVGFGKASFFSVHALEVGRRPSLEGLMRNGGLPDIIFSIFR
jgi:hypothetical protein